MLRKVSLVFGLGILVSLSAQAQDKMEAFGGYSYLYFHTSPSASLNGWEVSGLDKFTDWLGGVADIDGHYGSILGVGTSTYTYLFGPQVSWPASVSPFGHLLLGGAHNSTAGFGNSSFSMALGGGFDAKITDKLYWQIIQGDYLLTQFGGRLDSPPGLWSDSNPMRKSACQSDSCFSSVSCVAFRYPEVLVQRYYRPIPGSGLCT